MFLQTNARRTSVPFAGTAARDGVTLIEILVATAITLILIGAMSKMFSDVTSSVVDSRGAVEMSDRLRMVRDRLQQDLAGATAPTRPPLRPEAGEGYLEIIEGPIGPITSGVSLSSDEVLDDCDDILMFTSRSLGVPFTGLYLGNPEKSQTAEIIWFMRGTNLYRRVLMIVPSFDADDISTASYSVKAQYRYNDVSLRTDAPLVFVGGAATSTMSLGFSPNFPNTGAIPVLRANTLGDLTKRENRYCHQPFVYPHEARFFGFSSSAKGTSPQDSSDNAASYWPAYGMPILAECCTVSFPWPYYGDSSTSRPNSTTTSSTSSTPGAGSHVLFQAVYPQAYFVVPTLTSDNTIAVGASNPNVPGMINGHMSVPGSAITPTEGYDRSRLYRTGGTTGIRWMHNYSFSSNVSRMDDLILTNCAGFDVKVWDPGAPVFEVAQTVTISGTATMSTNTTIAPGDPAYPGTLKFFISSPTSVNAASGGIRNIAFGAYADLGYFAGAAVLNGIGTESQILNYTCFPAEPFLQRTVAGGVSGAGALEKYEGSAALGAAYRGTLPRPHFGSVGDPRSGVAAGQTSGWRFNVGGGPMVLNSYYAAVYDTWSTHYEYDGIDNGPAGAPDGIVDSLYNGVDDDNGAIVPSGDARTINADALVDNDAEAEAPPPYPLPLRSIQVRIRTYDGDTQQVRETHITHQFIPD